MVNVEVIRKRLNKLDGYLQNLQIIQKYERDEFKSEFEHHASAERLLHLAIEAINDIGNHIVAYENMGVVNWQSDIPKLLQSAGHIDSEMKDKWIKMIGFRNTLVHDYTEIDLDIVYEVVQTQLTDIRKLQKIFAKWI